jgi:hypothetical protein
MRLFSLMSGVVVAVGLLSVPTNAMAQTPAGGLQQEIQQLRKDFDSLKQDYEARLAALEEKLSAAQTAATTAPPPQTTVTTAEGTALPVYGGAATGSKIFNPDIAVIGNFIGTGGHNAVAPSPALAMKESEASFQAIVDPYARADFFLSFGETGVDLEEGYATFTSLPGGLLTRVGKMRAAFGKVNMFHSHVSPWADRPLVTQNLLGGEEGLSDAGVSIARLIPNRWLFLEATGQVFRGDSGDVFTSSQPGDLNYLAHVRGYQDLSESTNIDLGFSYSHGHNAAGIVDGTDVGRFTTDLYGIDGTVRWRPLRRSIYHSFIGRGEMVWSRREQFGGQQNAMGYFVSGDYQLARRWFTGIRYDRSDHADDATLFDRGGSVVFSYWPSEFSQVRGQYRHTRYASDSAANELLFQLVFSIGAHGAHPF